jgi:hypothetical protein
VRGEKHLAIRYLIDCYPDLGILKGKGVYANTIIVLKYWADIDGLQGTLYDIFSPHHHADFSAQYLILG